MTRMLNNLFEQILINIKSSMGRKNKQTKHEVILKEYSWMASNTIMRKKMIKVTSNSGIYEPT